MKCLAFDLGASSGRAMLAKYDGNKIALDEIHRFSNDPVTFQGVLHWDALRIMHEMRTALLECVRKGHRDIAGMATDTWGVDFGLLDKQGRLLANPVHYRDTRTDGMMEEAAQQISDRTFYEHTGIQFMKLNTVYQLLAMKKQQPKLLDLADRLLFMPDLFNYYLCGQKNTEYSIASTSQMLHANTRTWDKEVVSMLGIKGDILQEPVPSATCAERLDASLSEETGIKDSFVISVGGHDTASAVLAVPSTTPDFAYISSGTWSLLGTECEQPVINDDTYRLNYTNEGGYENTIRLLKNIMGLWVLQESKRHWEKQEGPIHFDDLDAQAEQAEPFYAFIDPDHASFYEPGDMPARIQAYCEQTGQAVPKSKGQICRCIMESLAMKYKYALAGLERIRNRSYDRLHVVGGGCKNIILLRFTASAIGREVVAGPVEATSAGNILGQLLYLGELRDKEQARQLSKASFTHVVYEPKETEAWEQAYERFRKVTDLDEEEQ